MSHGATSTAPGGEFNRPRCERLRSCQMTSRSSGLRPSRYCAARASIVPGTSPLTPASVSTVRMLPPAGIARRPVHGVETELLRLPQVLDLPGVVGHDNACDLHRPWHG